MAVGLVAVVVHGGHGERLAGRVGGEKRDGPLTQLRGGGEVSLLFEAHPRLEVRARDPVQRHGERGGGPFCHRRAASNAYRVLDRRVEQPDDAVARPGTRRSAVQVRDAEAGRAARGRGGNAHRDGVVRLVRVFERRHAYEEVYLAGGFLWMERCRVRRGVEGVEAVNLFECVLILRQAVSGTGLRGYGDWNGEFFSLSQISPYRQSNQTDFAGLLQRLVRQDAQGHRGRIVVPRPHGCRSAALGRRVAGPGLDGGGDAPARFVDRVRQRRDVPGGGRRSRLDLDLFVALVRAADVVAGCAYVEIDGDVRGRRGVCGQGESGVRAFRYERRRPADPDFGFVRIERVEAQGARRGPDAAVHPAGRKRTEGHGQGLLCFVVRVARDVQADCGGRRCARAAGECDRGRVGRKVCARKVGVARSRGRRAGRGQRVVCSESCVPAERERDRQAFSRNERAAERYGQCLRSAFGYVAGWRGQRDGGGIVVRNRHGCGGDADQVAELGAAYRRQEGDGDRSWQFVRVVV